MPVYTTSAPRFAGDIFIRSIVANDDPIPMMNRRSTSANPTVASGAAGEGVYILGNTNAFIEVRRGSTTAGSISASVGTIPPEPVFQVNDTVGINNIYRINDDESIGIDHFVIPGRVWTINQTGLSNSMRFDIAIYCGALTGIVRPQNLYIAYRRIHHHLGRHSLRIVMVIISKPSTSRAMSSGNLRLPRKLRAIRLQVS